MLTRGPRRLLFDRLRLLRGRNHTAPLPPVMALNQQMISTSFCSLAHAKEGCRVQRKAFLDLGIGAKCAPSSALGLKGCLNWRDVGLRKVDGGATKITARVMTPNRQLLRDSEVLPLENDSVKKLNGNGKPLGFPEHPVSTKMVIAVDVDEVLGSFLAALNKFIADRYSLYHSVSEYYVYEFFKIWNCSRTRADLLVHEFFETHYFQDGIHPIPGARDALQNLSSFCSLSVVTSRQNAIKNHTLEWIEKHYPCLFEEIHFGNHFALDGQSKPKSVIGRSLGAQVLIDDNPRYALECAEVGMRVLLFNYHNSYPWCNSDIADSHPLVTKVYNWQEVEQKLLSWVVPEKS